MLKKSQNLQTDDPCMEGQISAVFPRYVVLRFSDEKSCAGCGIKHLCSEKQITLERDLFKGNPEAGQKVRVIYHKVFQTAAIVYLLPLLFFFGGIAAVRWLWGTENEPLQFFAAFAALAIGLLVLNRLNKILSAKKYKIEVETIEEN